MRLRIWQWWWEGEFLPERFLGRDLIWSVNQGGPVAWPGRIRCWLLRSHVDDGYGNCVYCGWWDRSPWRRPAGNP